MCEPKKLFKKRLELKEKICRALRTSKLEIYGSNNDFYLLLDEIEQAAREYSMEIVENDKTK